MKKIAIFQANLKVGGIQRSLVNLLNSSILDQYEVDVFLFSKEIFYNINGFKKNIHIYFLKPFPYWFRFVPFSLIKKMQYYTTVKDQYDFAFDFDSYRQECAYCTLKMQSAKKILWIHNDIGKELQFNKKYRLLYIFFRSKFKFYDEFVAVSEGVIPTFRKYSSNRKSKIRVIPNLIDTKQICADCQKQIDFSVEPHKVNIICVGRIYIQKGYDLLLKDFYYACKKRQDLHCYIIGDGPDLKRCQKWVEKHNITDAVSFLGNQKNPFAYMAQMDAFCLESRYEGQGMVLWEAKCLGLQLIFPKRLEKYNIYLTGADSVQDALIKLQKAEKKYDSLEKYQSYIEAQYGKLLEGY